MDSRVSVQFISHFTERYSYLDSVELALRGGCKWVQLRMKGAGYDELRGVAMVAQRMCREAGAVFVIDDNVELVREIGADGVHLGKMDMGVDVARSILGEGAIIGGTANSFEDVVGLCAKGVDYIGCGPFRFTTTKSGLAPVLGLDGYRGIVERMRGAGIGIPMVAIGGIALGDIGEIMATGVSGIALSGSVLRAEDPVAEMGRVVSCVEGYVKL